MIIKLFPSGPSDSSENSFRSKLPPQLGNFNIEHSKIALVEQMIGNCMILHKAKATKNFSLEEEFEKIKNLPPYKITSYKAIQGEEKTDCFYILAF